MGLLKVVYISEILPKNNFALPVIILEITVIEERNIGRIIQTCEVTYASSFITFNNNKGRSYTQLDSRK